MELARIIVKEGGCKHWVAIAASCQLPPDLPEKGWAKASWGDAPERGVRDGP